MPGRTCRVRDIFQRVSHSNNRNDNGLEYLTSVIPVTSPVNKLLLLLLCLTGFSGSLALLCVPGVVVFACNGMLSVLTTLFLSNSVDYGQLKTGRREESVIFSMQTFVVKAASGVAVFLTGIGLDLIGLAGNAEETGPVAAQSAGTLLGYLPLLLVPPAVGIMVQWQRIGADFWAIAAALVLSLLVGIPLTGALMQWLIRRQLGREGRP